MGSCVILERNRPWNPSCGYSFGNDEVGNDPRQFRPYAVFVAVNDSDGDRVPNDDDFCPDTVIPESVPTVSLGVHRFALVDSDGEFDTTTPSGMMGPNRSYTIADTAGCSCTQITDAQGLGQGYTKHGCSIGVMDRWVELVTP